MLKRSLHDYSDYLKSLFGERVHKISINAGFSCPNRDGTKGIGGCTYCNNQSFSPNYCVQPKDITAQLQSNSQFLVKRNKAKKYLAYFQSYTNTYGDIELLKSYYTTALEYPDIVGIIIATRPDCINSILLDYLEDLSKETYVSLEIGIESTLNSSLLKINRCHTYEDTLAAYEMAQNRGIDLGAHLILGLPGESKEQMLAHADKLNELPIKTLKLHHLQIVKHTVMAAQFKKEPEKFHLFTPNEYMDLVLEFSSRLRADIIIERLVSESSLGVLVAPNWGGLKNSEFFLQFEKCQEKRVTNQLN